VIAHHKCRVGRAQITIETGYKPSHGPQSWPWWRLLSLSLINLRVVNHFAAPGLYWRLWIYTRWGAALIDLDRFPDEHV
jgi:hypothetical protein